MSLIRKIQVFGSNVAKLWTIDEANTARTTSTIVGVVQEIDSTGKVSPAGDTLANAPFNKNTNYNSSGTEIFTSTDRGYVDSLSTKSNGLSSTASIVNVTTTATSIVSANTSRLTVQIQNQGTVPILLKIGSNPTTLDYHMILTAASALRLGDGGVFGTATSLLSIVGITESSTADVSVVEEEY